MQAEASRILTTLNSWVNTNGIPSGLVADLISFLASQPVIDQLRDTSYIACADRGGSKLDGACSRS